MTAIRKATHESAELIASLNQHVHALHIKSHPEVFNTPTLEETAEFLRTYLAQENMHTFVIYSDTEEPMGYMITYVRDLLGHVFVKPQRYLYIDQIGILPAYQHQGYGASLVAKAKELALELNASQVRLDVWDFNHPSQIFFQHQGFSIFNLRMWWQP